MAARRSRIDPQIRTALDMRVFPKRSGPLLVLRTRGGKYHVFREITLTSGARIIDRKWKGGNANSVLRQLWKD